MPFPLMETSSTSKVPSQHSSLFSVRRANYTTLATVHNVARVWIIKWTKTVAAASSFVGNFTFFVAGRGAGSILGSIHEGSLWSMNGLSLPSSLLDGFPTIRSFPLSPPIGHASIVAIKMPQRPKASALMDEKMADAAVKSNQRCSRTSSEDSEHADMDSYSLKISDARFSDKVRKK